MRVVETPDAIGAIAVSRDGRRIAYGRRNGNGTEVGVVAAEGGAGHAWIAGLPAIFPRPESWSPDGRFLPYFDGPPRVLNTETGAGWRLLEIAEQPRWIADGASWAPDGTFVILSGTETRSIRLAITVRGVTYDAVNKLAGTR